MFVRPVFNQGLFAPTARPEVFEARGRRRRVPLPLARLEARALLFYVYPRTMLPAGVVVPRAARERGVIAVDKEHAPPCDSKSQPVAVSGISGLVVRAEPLRKRYKPPVAQPVAARDSQWQTVAVSGLVVNAPAAHEVHGAPCGAAQQMAASIRQWSSGPTVAKEGGGTRRLRRGCAEKTSLHHTEAQRPRTCRLRESSQRWARRKGAHRGITIGFCGVPFEGAVDKRSVIAIQKIRSSTTGSCRHQEWCAHGKPPEGVDPDFPKYAKVGLRGTQTERQLAVYEQTA
eukprot:6287577-Pyramimonas_sp.AAC.2